MPIEPDAPGWLTMTTFWPSAFSISAAVTRVTWSVEPPAAHGTMMVIGFVGFQVACAEAGAAASASAAASAARQARRAGAWLVVHRCSSFVV